MRKAKPLMIFFAIATIAFILSGCGRSPLAKPDTNGMERNSNFSSASNNELYSLEESADKLHSAIIKKDWANAQRSYAELRKDWNKVKRVADERRTAEGNIALNKDFNRRKIEANDNLNKLSNSINAQKISASNENLNEFMTNVSKLGKDYKLSPVSDVIGIGVVLRDIEFHIRSNDWEKAEVKSKELENMWNQSKPTLEHAGISGEVVRLHSIINQTKSAVNVENRRVALEHLSNAKESLGKIRKFYYEG